MTYKVFMTVFISFLAISIVVAETSGRDFNGKALCEGLTGVKEVWDITNQGAASVSRGDLFGGLQEGFHRGLGEIVKFAEAETGAFTVVGGTGYHV